jgi:hypothetical protein
MVRLLFVVAVLCTCHASAFVPSSRRAAFRIQELRVSELEKEVEADKAKGGANKKSAILNRSAIPPTLRIEGRGIPNRNDRIQLLDTSTYEANLINSWDVDPERQKGFDWEIEKARRYFAGLRLREDGSWVKQPSFFDFLVSERRMSSLADAGTSPKPVNVWDVVVLVCTNLLSSLGFGSALGMAAIPDAVIQKYEGTFLSFIKGVLGGDLQTLAGGPLFLLLAKYYQDYGPIFNLSFGPKSFLVISDPVMARHILRETPADQYCKGMLAEILVSLLLSNSLCLFIPRKGTSSLFVSRNVILHRNLLWERVLFPLILPLGKSAVGQLFLAFTNDG